MKHKLIEKSKIVEKVFFNSKKISLENEKFSLKATVFVPKADLKKPQPKVCLTIDICNNKVRLVSAHPEDIVNALIDIKCWYEEIMNNAQLVLEKERDTYIKLIQEQVDSQKTKKIDMAVKRLITNRFKLIKKNKTKQ